MFTGIIERVGTVTAVRTLGTLRTVTIAKPGSWKLTQGQSINVDGICSTVVRSTATSFTVDYMPETLRTTTASSFSKGTRVNLERSLKYGDRMDGHVVQGHVETRGRITSITNEGRSRLFTVRFPAGISRFAYTRGSIALSGVSLTVARKHGPSVTVALVPHTLTHTTFSDLREGSEVNVETDSMVRATVRPHAAKTLRKTR